MEIGLDLLPVAVGDREVLDETVVITLELFLDGERVLDRSALPLLELVPLVAEEEFLDRFVELGVEVLLVVAGDGVLDIERTVELLLELTVDDVFGDGTSVKVLLALLSSVDFDVDDHWDVLSKLAVDKLVSDPSPGGWSCQSRLRRCARVVELPLLSAAVVETFVEVQAVVMFESPVPRVRAPPSSVLDGTTCCRRFVSDRPSDNCGYFPNIRNFRP
ncbi:hypothetical protein K458DRAFT_401868 [Lentithecium fluviatile CBS 122367]|uniref:Uncharacterized protein n=1 Tax=Lentithecium fluviatile CBS 122367 TaxID=1168545 RepID=A0A6G1JAX5_9PLEO|nr:hypothetical protein K458DRAFT_401868 [Lentithecium fluviatile CBS 122367]